MYPSLWGGNISTYLMDFWFVSTNRTLYPYLMYKMYVNATRIHTHVGLYGLEFIAYM